MRGPVGLGAAGWRRSADLDRRSPRELTRKRSHAGTLRFGGLRRSLSGSLTGKFDRRPVVRRSPTVAGTRGGWSMTLGEQRLHRRRAACRHQAARGARRGPLVRRPDDSRPGADGRQGEGFAVTRRVCGRIWRRLYVLIPAPPAPPGNPVLAPLTGRHQQDGLRRNAGQRSRRRPTWLAPAVLK
jgi:hypothetical protein